MTAKITINIDDRAFEFLKQVTNNRSAYINNLLLEKEREQLEDKLREAYREQNQDTEFQQSIKDWDVTVGDGLDEM
ncbi:hypothetical protein STA3757_47140 [Stanieria sp. NIES-3757]|nr:hypothetical protein STA3757_47140 [Stanieria sp. NIES-3757]